MKNEEKKESTEEKCLNQEDKEPSAEKVSEKAQKRRQILIKTDGTNIEIVKAEVSNLELQAILSNLLRQITSR